MVFTPHFCAACGSAHIRRNGSAAGHAKYQCKSCGHPARFVPAAVAKAARYAQADQVLVERNSQRSIARATGLARVTVARRVKKSVVALAPRAAPAAEKGAEKALGSPGIGRDVAVCGPQKA